MKKHNPRQRTNQKKKRVKKVAKKEFVFKQPTFPDMVSGLDIATIAASLFHTRINPNVYVSRKLKEGK